MLRLTLRNLWAHKRRALGASAAIVLGVAFLTATLTLGDTLDAGVSSVFREANAGTDVVVRNGSSFASEDGRQRGPIAADLADRVAAVDGVAAVAPDASATAQVLGADGDPVGGEGPPTVAHGWIADPELNPYRITTGRSPAADGEIVVDVATAEAGDLQVGDEVTVLTPEPVTTELVGLVSFGDRDSLLGSTYIAMTPTQAADVLVEPGMATELRVRGDGSRSSEELRGAVAEVLPASAEAVTGAAVAAEQQADLDGEFTGFLTTFLVAFAGIAVVVATFSIANTLSIISAQRSREAALLRAVGATRRQVVWSTMAESFVLSVLASSVGIGVGLVLSGALRALLAWIGLDLSGSALVVEPRTVAVAMAVGVLATLVAAVAPAVRSGRIAPIQALRQAAAEVPRTSRARAVAGLVVTLLGAAIVVVAPRSDSAALGRAGLGALLVLVGAVLLSAVVARPVTAVLGAPVAATGVPGRLARRNAARNPRRTAGASLALVIGAAVVALFATFGSSLRTSIDLTVDRTFGGDLVIAQTSFSGAPISPEVAREVAALPEVERAVGLASVVAQVGEETVYPTAGDPAAMDALLDLDVTAGSIADLDPGEVAVAQAYADDEGLEIGSTVTLTYADGTSADLEVGALYGVRELLGDLVITTQDWAPHAPQAGDVAVLAELREGVSLEEGRAAVQAVAERNGAPDVEDREQYIDRVAGQVDQVLILVYGLLGLAIVIALLGLGNALSLSIHERTRELGLLRAVGLSRRGVRASVRWEAVITAVLGTTLGLAVGGFLGWGLVRALDAQEGFVTYQAPTTTLLVVFALACAAGVAASVRPARRAARIDVLEAISEP